MILKSTFALAVVVALAIASSTHCREGTEEEEACLLQQREPRELRAKAAHPLAPRDAESQRARLQKALPIAWVHVPKCGSSFLNFLVHLPGVCPGVPDDLIISYKTFGEMHAYGFEHQYKALDKDGACPGGFSHIGGHEDYHYGQASWPYGREKPARDEVEYLQRMQGCMVRMLVHKGDMRVSCGGRDYSWPPTDDEVKLAVKRLRTGFTFVGITEQWPLSICLGHRMLGGRCRTSDFVDTRVTARSGGLPQVKLNLHPEPWDVSPLKGLTDPYDGAVYKAAQEIFAENLQRHNVSFESCKPCFEEAGIEIDSSA